jgi:hypothetical protein
MSLFSIKGTVTAIGQSQFDNSITFYAYLEITEPSGRRIKIDQVAVCNDIASALRLGQSGEFFVDRIFRFSKTYRCQLWGIKSDGVATIDSIDIRKRVAGLQFVLGILTIPIFGLGLLLAVPALFKILSLGAYNRNQMFYGSDPVEARRLSEQQVVRI